MVRKKGKNKTKYILIFLIVFLLSISATAFVYSRYKIVDVKYIPIEFSVGDVIGLTIDTDRLHFGRIPAGSGAIRKINITNNKEFDVKVNIGYSSEDMNWVNIGDNGFILNPQEEKIIKIMVNVPKWAQNGNYTANLKIMMLRP